MDEVGWPDPASVDARMLSTASCAASSFHSWTLSIPPSCSIPSFDERPRRSSLSTERAKACHVATPASGREDSCVRLPVMPPVAPMLAKPIENIPTGPFSFEPKWDGFRSIVFRDGEEVEIGSRNERPMTRYFPEVVDAIKANLPERCVVDGEVVVPDPAGRRLEFETLQQRIHPADSRVRLLAGRTPAHFVAFDLLALGDRDYTREPFAGRRRTLEQSLAGAASPIHVTPATTDRDVADQWLRTFEGAGLDGLIAKPLDGTYQPGKRVMFKIKHVRTADRVVEVRYDHMEGPRFRHTTQFVRWRTDRDPLSCTFAQLQEPVRFDLEDILGS